jgi:acyl carrier protein
MTRNEFLRALELQLEVPQGSLQGPEVLGDLKGWDSMAAVLFIALADERLQVSVGADRIARCKTIDDLLGLLGDSIRD